MIPLLEFDPDRPAMIEPGEVIEPLSTMPTHGVLCFFQDVITQLKAQGDLEEIAVLKSEIGLNPIYRLNVDGQPIAVLHPGVGAPLAAAFLEEAIALGGRKFVACGGAGTLDSRHEVGKLMIPTAAVRDEGTSYHYLPPDAEATPSGAALQAILTELWAAGIPFEQIKTWTTDAFYRETRGKVQTRKAQGCVAVEMEAAALFAVAAFRGVELGQILYAGDDLGGELWDSRNWGSHQNVRHQLLYLAARACLRI